MDSFSPLVLIFLPSLYIFGAIFALLQFQILFSLLQIVRTFGLAQSGSTEALEVTSLLPVQGATKVQAVSALAFAKPGEDR